MSNISDITTIDLDEYTIVDVRPSEEFINGFIPGSIHIPLKRIEKNFLLLRNLPAVIVVGADAQEASSILQDKNIRVAGTIPEGVDQWKNAGHQLDLIIQIEADEYAMDQAFDERLMLIDVRKAEAYKEEHVEGAVSIPLESFTDIIHIASIEDETNVYVHCGGGSSAVTAASLFKRQGFHSIRVIEGGFAALKNEPRVQTVMMKKEEREDEEKDLPEE